MSLIQQDIANTWIARIKRADERFEEWAVKFKVQICERYYEGFQWNVVDTPDYDPYTINLVFSTINIKLPNLIFDEPIAAIKPKPARAAWNEEEAAFSARLKEDILNTFLLDPDNEVAEEIELAVLDSFFGFGLIEVGFSSDWVQNPNIGKPFLNKKGEVIVNRKGKPLKQPALVPVTERNYIKRIPFDTARVGGIESPRLKRCGWVGYYEWVHIADILANPYLKNVDQISFPSGRSEDFIDENAQANERDLTRRGDLLKVFHIWDKRTQTRLLIDVDGGNILKEEPFKRLPLFPITFFNRRRGFYPIPPVFNWLSPQQELNDTREMLRVHRRRFVRKYLYNKGKIQDQQERDKLEYGPDGTFVGVDGDPQTVVAPLQNADLGAASIQIAMTSKDDFNIISGTTAEVRGEADRVTATAATITNQFAKERRTSEALKVAKVLKAIFREILLQMRDKNTLPYWVESSQGWMLTDIGALLDDDYDFAVNIFVSSISAIAQEDDKRAFLEFLSVLTNFPQIAMSPELVREAANKVGYRNEKVLKQMMEMATIAMLGQIEMGKQSLGVAMAQRNVAQMTPNTGEQINNQLKNQLGLVQ